MHDFHRALPNLPNHWIGVDLRWNLMSDSPWNHLVSITPIELKTHALLIGATGSGKTNLLHHLIAQDIACGHSLIILDLRGDLVSATLELCAGNVDPSLVKVIDLREKERPFGFNPLSGKGEPYFRALSVLQAVATESNSWGVQLAETLRNALLLLAETREPLTQLESLLYDRDFRASCIERCNSESVTGFWQRYGDLSAEKQRTLAMPVVNKVSLLLATDTLRRILGHTSPIDLAHHLNTPGSILLVSLAVDELHGSGRMMGNLVLSSICREIFARVEISERSRNPVRLYVDEFEHFGMAEFETILSEGRRFGLHLVLAHQTLAQLSPKMRSLILGNVGTKAVFRYGRDDCAVLSKDLFGDPKSYDFSDLGVGETVLWRRGQDVLEVEVNEPLLRDVGRLSAEARLFRAHVHRFAGESLKPTIAARPLQPDVQKPANTSVARRVQLTSDVEDWLCG